MNKFVFALVALLAIASASAKPNYPAPYTATYNIPAPPPVAYVEIPLPAQSYAPKSTYGAAAPYIAPSYGKPAYGNPSYGNPSYGNPSYVAPSYIAPAYGPSTVYQPIVKPYLNYGSIPSLLAPAPSNPAATATAASSTAALKAGSYNQLIVPSWSVLSEEPLPNASPY